MPHIALYVVFSFVKKTFSLLFSLLSFFGFSVNTFYGFTYFVFHNKDFPCCGNRRFSTSSLSFLAFTVSILNLDLFSVMHCFASLFSFQGTNRLPPVWYTTFNKKAGGE